LIANRGKRFSLLQNFQRSSGVQLVSYSVGTKISSLEVKHPGCGTTVKLNLVLKLRIGGAILLPPYAIMEWDLISQMDTLTFTSVVGVAADEHRT
jgi:hypothetical protein